VLRYDPPVQLLMRVAGEDLSVGATTVPSGSVVLLLLAAASRDPAVNEEPDRFDIGRTQLRHLAFGFGAHFCLGAPLARDRGTSRSRRVRPPLPAGAGRELEAALPGQRHPAGTDPTSGADRRLTSRHGCPAPLDESRMRAIRAASGSTGSSRVRPGAGRAGCRPACGWSPAWRRSCSGCRAHSGRVDGSAGPGAAARSRPAGDSDRPRGAARRAGPFPPAP